MPAWRVWLLAARPKTLWAGVAPVVVGTAMAFADDAGHWPSAVAALLGAVLIQIGANYANDYFDFVKGTDTADRIGPVRATQAGLVSPTAMRNATIVVFALAFLPGLYIVGRGGWPFVVIGLVSILCAVLYTAGPYPLGYLGLGDLFVFLFYGLVAVCGTYYLQAFALTRDVVIASIAPGLLSVALLTVNNLRDIDQDRAGGKRTLAVRFGRGFARFEYLFCVLVAAMVVPFYFYGTRDNHYFLLVSLLTLLPGVPSGAAVLRTTSGTVLNQVLARTGKMLLIYSVTFALAVLVRV